MLWVFGRWSSLHPRFVSRQDSQAEMLWSLMMPLVHIVLTYYNSKNNWNVRLFLHLGVLSGLLVVVGVASRITRMNVAHLYCRVVRVFLFSFVGCSRCLSVLYYCCSQGTIATTTEDVHTRCVGCWIYVQRSEMHALRALPLTHKCEGQQLAGHSRPRIQDTATTAAASRQSKGTERATWGKLLGRLRYLLMLLLYCCNS